MKTTVFATWLLVLALPVFSQSNIRLEIQSLPAYHSQASTLYLAGNFNGWNPKDERFRFQQDETGKYFIVMKLDTGAYEYKITRGGWERVECGKGGPPIENRKLNVNGNLTLSLNIEEWQDRFPPRPAVSTASRNVRILDAGFKIPQLGRVRRIWIYIPHNDGFHRMPVLYMQDGQNLFDNATAFAGEWGIDEFMDTTSLQDCIIVGIDNGGQTRINEYSPYDMDRFGLGEGDHYLDFIVNTLKPYIDKNFPTYKDRSHTYIAGSSMGGLISLYALLKYPKVFGGAGVFSPALWVAPKIYSDIRKKGKKFKGEIYFYAGKQESESMVPDLLRAFEDISKVSKSRITTVIRDEGKHNEAAWRKEFPEFYKWIFD